MGPTLSRESLALQGARPVRDSFLPYGRQSIEEADIQAVVDVLRSDWLTTGPKIAEFEEAFAAYVGARFAVGFSSGTAALHGAAFAAGIGVGDEVVTTPLTFAATANCVLYQGGIPVFADASPDTLNLDPDRLAAVITSRTKAIIPVDYAGHPADLDSILALANQNGLIVIEDACHALGAQYDGRKVGAIADMTVFSFHPVKHLTTGEGGMVTTNDPKFAETLRAFRNHGITTEARDRQNAGQWHYEMVLLGYNYRLSDISCALGLSQLRRLDSNLERRRRIAARYSSAMRNLPGIILPAVRQHVLPAWHLYPIRVDERVLGVSRDEILRGLRAENIGVNVHYIPVHLHPYYKERFGYRGGEFPVAEAAYETLITLPMFHGMTDRDVEDVIRAIDIVTQYFRASSS